MRRNLAQILLTFLLLSSSSQAFAHKLKVFATAIGAEVSGYAYFSPGGRAQEADVIVKQADGSLVATLKTNEQGEFTFNAVKPVDHMIMVDAGDGHEATYTLTAAELGGLQATTTPAATAVTSESSATTLAYAGPSSAEIAAIVEQSVARQIRPLREQIDGWQEKVWLHDVLGGLGYIIGLGGLFYGLTGLRRSREERAVGNLKEVRR